MDQTESALNIGDVIDALGINLPAGDETPEAPLADQETVADETIDTTTTDEQPEDGQPEESPEDSDDAIEAADDSDDSDDATDEPVEAEPAAVKKLHKRVDKLTARAKSAEEQAATLQTELAAARDALTKAQPIVLQDNADPLAEVTTSEMLEARVAAANTVLDNVPDLIAKAELEGEVEVATGNGSSRKFSKAELQDRLRLARQILRAEPARRTYLAQRETFQQEARVAYPEMFKDGSESRQVLLQTLRAYPALAKLPNLELIVGDAMRGQALRFQAVSKPASKPAAKAAPAKPAVAPKVVNPSSAPKTKSQADPLQMLKTSGTRDAAENFVASLFN